MTAKTCAHPSCECSVKTDQMFCSEVCLAHSDGGDLDVPCKCGHLDCRGDRGLQKRARIGVDALGDSDRERPHGEAH